MLKFFWPTFFLFGNFVGHPVKSIAGKNIRPKSVRRNLFSVVKAIPFILRSPIRCQLLRCHYVMQNYALEKVLAGA